MDMGTFIVGVLFGWLIEWLFFKFFVNSGDSSVSDCSSYERELKTRNEEIKALKATLGTNNKTAGKDSVVSLMSKTAKSTVSSTNKTATKKSASAKNSAPAKKSTATTKSVPTKPASAKKSSSAKKPISKKATSTKKPAAKKATTAKTTAKKAAPKKIALKKNIDKPTAGDDLTKLSGIGPSMAATMNELGITTYTKLAAMDDDILRDMLEASGARLNNNKEAMDSWNEQATLAGKGDFAGLKKLQEAIKV
jgi:predicted flap endonuclease-1-like 5' DNA nuclease